jgi:tetratricopeptide (TPR) repeat protein
MRSSRDKHIIRLLQAAVVAAILVIGAFVCTATALALLQIGGKSPDFSLSDIDGRNVTLSQFGQKKAVVLLFWSTWSSNSPRALKRFEDYWRKYGDRGIQIVGINADNQMISSEDAQKVRDMVKQLGITYPMAFDKALSTFNEYNVIALPSVIVAKDGKITYELPGMPLVGTEELFDYLLELAGEPVKKKVALAYQPRHDALADTNLARGFVKKKQNALAYPLFEKAIDKDPHYLLPYIELAKLYELEGKPAEAEGILKKALAAVPGNVVAMSELGYVQAISAKYQEALELLIKAAKDDSYPPAQYYLGYALGLNGQLKEALAVFQRAIEMNPFATVAYRLRAEIYEKNKMEKEAAADYQKALELMLKVRN